jgi:hypothetical protein
MKETIDFQFSLCPIAPLRILALSMLALGRMFLSIIEVISRPELWACPDPEYRHLYAPLPQIMRKMMGMHPLFIVPPRSYILRRARKKAVVGVMVRHLQRLDALEDSALQSFALFYARKNRLSRLKRKAAANRKF